MLGQNYNLGAKGSVNFTPGGPGGSLIPNIANLSDLSNFSVNWNQWEALTQSLYDSAPYPAAGTTGLTFFQNPIGQGTGFGGGAKTASDTNMTLAGMLATGIMQIVTSIEVDVQPTTPTVTAQMPAVFGAQAAAQIVNDAYIIRRSGNLVFHVLSKNYLTEAPLMQFPAASDFVAEGALADTTTAAASSQSRIAWGTAAGPLYSLTPNNILLISNQNFNITLNWPEGVQAITNPARIFVRLNGIQFRLAQ
jgi:hypothetical protein